MTDKKMKTSILFGAETIDSLNYVFSDRERERERCDTWPHESNRPLHLFMDDEQTTDRHSSAENSNKYASANQVERERQSRLE